jgi:hypothetical protein
MKPDLADWPATPAAFLKWLDASKAQWVANGGTPVAFNRAMAELIENLHTLRKMRSAKDTVQKPLRKMKIKK